MQTYKQARLALLARLQVMGWHVKPTLKVPQAISPDEKVHLFFKPQAVYCGRYSMWIDIRKITPAAFVAEAYKATLR